MVGFKSWLSLLVGVIPSLVNAIQDGQAGVNDWHLQHVGSPLSMLTFDNGLLDLVLVNTEQNYIAALNNSNGAIVWRRSSNSLERVKKINLSRGMLWATSEIEDRTYLRFFDPSRGALLWEHRLKMPSAYTTINTCFSRKKTLKEHTHNEVDITWLGSNEYLTVVKNKILTLSKIGTSKPMWVWEPKSTDEVVIKTYYHSSKIVVVGVHAKSSQVFIYTLDEVTGDIINYKLLEGYLNEALEFQFIGGKAPYLVWPKIVCNDSFIHLEAIMALSLNGDIMSTSPTLHQVSEKDGIPFDEISLVSFTGGSFYLQYSLNKIVNTISFQLESDQVKAIGIHQLQENLMDTTEKFGQLVYLTLSTKSTLKLVIPQNSSKDQIYHVDIDENIFGNIKKAFLGFQGQVTILMIVTYDGSVHFAKAYDKVTIVWYREESLSLASQSVMVELPDSHLWTQDKSDLEYVTDNLLLQYYNRIYNNIHSLTNVFLGQQEPQLNNSDNSTIPVRDRLGLRKFIIITTSSGKILALDSLNRGKIVWSRCIACASTESIVQVFLIRQSEFKLPPVLGVVIKNDDVYILIRIDGFTGLNLVSVLPSSQNWKSNVNLHQILMLPFIDSEEGTHILAFIDENKKVELVPSSPASIASICESTQSIHSFQNQNSSLSGLRIECDETSKVVARPVWHRDFLNERVLGLVSSSPSQVASPGRVMTDRRVLYKYINPHLAMFATNYDETIKVHLIDTVSGYVLYEAFHSSTSPDSFKAIIADHVVLYQYWDSSSSKGFSTVLLELFEDSQPDVRLSVNETFSSFTSHLPYVASRAFIIENGASALGVTQTRNGITNREFLFALNPINHIMGISHHYLDALRPYSKVPNQIDAEGVIPYSPVLPFNPKTVLSYDLDVSGIKHLVTSPVTYESTTLVLGYGLDVYLTSYAPSQQFDVLQEDFSKSALVATVVALIIGIAIAGPMLHQKKLREQWS